MPTPTTILKDISHGIIDIENTNLYDLINNHYNYRYWALNVHSLFQFGTVEIRFANSTTDLEKIEKFLDFSRKIVRAVRTKDTRLLGLLVKYRDDNIPLQELATELDMELKDDFSNKQKCERLLE
jgi:Putative amidoligase enzyme